MPVKNKLTDMHNILFEQLERLNDDDLTDEELEKEIRRAKAMSDISTNIIENANTLLKAQKYYDTEGNPIDKPRMLDLEDEKK